MKTSTIKSALLTSSILCLAGAAFAMQACSGAPSADTQGQNASAVHAASEPAADLSGTWVFDIDSSEVAASFKDMCAKKSNGDATKQAACWNEIHEEAGHEKIRFTKSGDSGQSVWRSFGAFGAKEIVFVEVPVDLAADGQGHVLAKVAGKATGEHAEQFAKSSINQMRIDVIDAKTIAMNDPKKGRLVYTKE